MPQPAAEKALKAFLILFEEEPRGHSVGDLCERAAHRNEAFVALVDDVRSLDVLSIPTRYPNGLPGGLPGQAFGPEDSERALEKAGRIIDAVPEAFDSKTCCPVQPMAAPGEPATFCAHRRCRR